MPKTKFQSIIFTLMMVFCMVYCMTAYTISLKMGSLNYHVFILAIQEMWLEYVVVFFLIFFVITRIAQKLTFRIFHPERDKTVFIILSMQTFTVACIVPMITLFSTIVHNGITKSWFIQWIQTAVLCLPMAFFLQVLYVGPLVRFVFRVIFRKQLAE